MFSLTTVQDMSIITAQVSTTRDRLVKCTRKKVVKQVINRFYFENPISPLLLLVEEGPYIKQHEPFVDNLYCCLLLIGSLPVSSFCLSLELIR